MQQMTVHKHFIGAAHSFEILSHSETGAGKYVRPDVTIVKTFFINDKVNVNDWQATWEGLKIDAQELPGTPLVLQEDLKHPKFSVQDMFDRGTIFDYDIDEENRQIIVYVRITDQKIIERIRSGELQYVSPAVIPRGSETLRKVGTTDVLDRTLPLHLAIVGDPAYGKDEAKITHMCTGDGKECWQRLKQMTASTQVNKIIKREHELLDQGVDEDEIHNILKKQFGDYTKKGSGIPELEQMPFIKKLIASSNRFTSSLEKIMTGSVLHTHEGKTGRWITAKGIDVFIAENQSIEEALMEQCGCSKLN